MLNRSPTLARMHIENKALILEIIRTNRICGASGGVTTLNIMHEAYLTYEQARRYLIELLEGKMIDRDVDSRKYMVTEKGIRYLISYYDLDNLTSNDILT